MSETQALLFARTFQSQVARNPGAACLTLPILRDLGVTAAVDELCPGGHDISHGQVITLLAANRLQAPRPLYKVGDWLERAGLSVALGIRPEQAHDTRLGEALDAAPYLLLQVPITLCDLVDMSQRQAAQHLDTRVGIASAGFQQIDRMLESINRLIRLLLSL